jgi:hypothetical protein
VFANMKMEELKQHERGILNMFEDEKHLKVYATQHNKVEGDPRTGKYVRLPSSDYS